MSFFIFLFISCFFGLCKAIDCGGKNVANTITVGRDGGAFTTIQGAIDSIKSNNDQWVKIHIKAGLYVEKVQIPLEKPCIILEGEGTINTVISFDDHQPSSSDSGTFISSASNVIASGITFKNSYNAMNLKYRLDESGRLKPITQAAAANLYGDEYFFHNCAFTGYQDTLFDAHGRHYFKDCYIEGEIDFIYGAGQSYYQNCSINAVGRSASTPGFVTAQSRESPDDPSGFVFEGGSVTGNGKVNLGRAWRAYSRVIFHQTYLSSIVTPQGWFAWNYIGHESNFTYAEVDCKGPGADTSKRVPWEKKLSDADIQEFSLASFINKDGWLDSLPTIS